MRTLRKMLGRILFAGGIGGIGIVLALAFLSQDDFGSERLEFSTAWMISGALFVIAFVGAAIGEIR